MASMKFNITLSQFPEQAKYIGDLLALWSTVERLYSSIIGTLIGPTIDQALLLLGSIESSRARLKFLETAGTSTLVNHKLLPDFQELVKVAGRALDYRNVYAHAIYAENEKGQLCRLNLKFPWPTEKKGNVVVSVHDVEAAWNKVQEAYQSAIAFIESLAKELPESYRSAIYAAQAERLALMNPPPEEEN